MNSDEINGYKYEFNITTIDSNHDLYSSQQLLNVYESEELIVKTPILSFNVRKSDSFSITSDIMPKIFKFIESKDKVINAYVLKILIVSSVIPLDIRPKTVSIALKANSTGSDFRTDL